MYISSSSNAAEIMHCARTRNTVGLFDDSVL